MFSNIEDKVRSYIEKNRLFNREETVYVAASGGADSMALLVYLNKFKDEFGISVGAVHVNHGIRGKTADRDANFVRDYCSREGIKFILFDASRDGTIVPDGASEEWARQLRYGYFNQLLADGVKIATAHTVSDQAETFLFRVSRGGSGLKGLMGIPVKRGSFVRPFLCINRSEVEELVEYYGCGHITDETNLGDDYSRNKIRHAVVPTLMSISDKADVNIVKVCERLGKAYDFVHATAVENLKNAKVKQKNGVYTVDSFYNIPDIVLEEMILMVCEEAGKCTEEYIEIIKNKVGKAQQKDKEADQQETCEEIVGVVPISNNVDIYITTKYITVHRKPDSSVKSVVVGNNTFGNFGYHFEVVEMDIEEFKSECKSKFELCNYADADTLNLDDLVIRRRSEGDKFKPACRMKGKLTKFMRNIPIAEREDIPVVEDTENTSVIWVYNVGFTDGYTPKEGTSKVYKFVSIGV